MHGCRWPRAEDSMLWVPGSILGDAGHAWGPMDPPIHLISTGPGPGHQLWSPCPGLPTGPSLPFPCPHCLVYCIHVMHIHVLSTPMYLYWYSRLHRGCNLIALFSDCQLTGCTASTGTYMRIASWEQNAYTYRT